MTRCQRNLLVLFYILIDRVATIYASTAANCPCLYLSCSVSYSVMTCSHPRLLFLSLPLCLIGRCSGLLPRPEHGTLLCGGASGGRRRRRVPGPVGSCSWVQMIRGWTLCVALSRIIWFLTVLGPFMLPLDE